MKTARGPALLYQIKRCAGPCTGEISIPDYAGLVDEARPSSPANPPP